MPIQVAAGRSRPSLRALAEPSSVAVVHDYLNQCGGAERVALELAQLWPSASVYTSLYRPQSTFVEFGCVPVNTTWLQRLPVDAGFRSLAPLYPLAFRRLGALQEQVVISSSSGWAHGVVTAPGSLHVVYCHTPARWLYRGEDYLGHRATTLMAPITRSLRRWDSAWARRADIYIVNSEHVRRRVRAIYRRDAHVINPPVDVARFVPRPRGERLLVVSRLLPYKRVDLIVRAATRAGIQLDVVGVGPSFRRLREMAGPNVTFHGRVDDDSLKELLEGCRALCVAATEDFGIAPVEAGAAGKPVVAYAAGGALETLHDGVNASLFHDRCEEAFLEAVRRADKLDTPPAEIASLAHRFSSEIFRSRFRSLIGTALAQRANGRVRSRGSVIENKPRSRPANKAPRPVARPELARRRALAAKRIPADHLSGASQSA